MWHLWGRALARIITGIMSLMDSANLRNRVFEIQNEHELMWTALDDIARMYKDQPVGDYAKNTLKEIKLTYGRKP
jgi:hypothetical protein